MNALYSYECIIIATPTVEEEQAISLSQDLRTKMEEFGAKVGYAEAWGKRKLAYEVKRQKFGFYFLVHFECETAPLKEIERILKYNENVIKFMIVRIKPDQVGKESPFKAEKPKEEA